MVERWQQNGLYFAGKITQDGHWLVWCSFEPLTECSPVHEPPEKEVWFERGNTKEEAIAKLLQEIG